MTAPTGTTGGAARSIGITFKPDILEFGSGLSTAPKSLTIKVTWWTPGRVVDTTFGISIYPTSKIVSWSYLRTNTQPTVTRSGAQTNISYTVGNTAVSITPTTFTAVSSSDHEAWGNTLIPVQKLYTILQYSLDGGTTYNLFPDNATGALFFATKLDSSCATSVNPLTYAFTLYCSD